MAIIFTDRAVDDTSYWKKYGNKTNQNTITKLLKSIEAILFEGIGNLKPKNGTNFTEANI